MRITISLGAVVLTGFANLAIASSVITGNYSYSPGGPGAGDVALTLDCGSYGTFNDEGTVSEDSGFQNFYLYITTCNNPAPDLSAAFTVTDGGANSISGTIEGFDENIGGNPELVAGTFTVTASAGIFTGADGYTDNFDSSTSVNYATGNGVGTFVVGAPEPAPMALCGFGAIAIGLFPRRRS